MAANQPLWPREWLMTDERMADRLWEAIEALPTGAGIVFRHYRLNDEDRFALGRAIAEIARTKDLLLAVAGSRSLAERLGAAMVHNPDKAGEMPWSMAVHDEQQALSARSAEPVLAFVGPVYPTHSHPTAEAIGADRAAALARQAGCAAIALGGMDRKRFALLESTHPGAFHGYAGIDCWLSRPLRT